MYDPLFSRSKYPISHISTIWPHNLIKNPIFVMNIKHNFKSSKLFLPSLYEKVCFFAIFQQELQNSTTFDGLLRFQISEKWANLRFPLNIQKQKVFQLQGASPPLTSDQGLCPWTPLGAAPPDPRYRLALRALAMPPLCQILNTPLVTLL